MAASTSVISVAILGDSKKFRNALGTAESKLKKFSRAAGLAFAGVAVAGAKMAFDIGRDIQTMEQNIIAGTGASGAALDGLIDSARNVATQVPASFDVVSQALADVNTNFGQTGAQLEETTELFLDFARVAGVDVGEAITIADSALTIFGENDANETLGDFLRIAQATGRPMAELLSSVEKFGPVFANMGFNLEETVALMGGLEQAGIDVTRISPGLNRFSREIADIGGDPREALEAIVEQIETATSDVDALKIATEAFGAEGAQRLSAAIRAGAFDLEDFNGLLGDGTGLVDEQADAVLTLGERFAMLKNRLAVKLMPTIERVIEFLEGLLEAIDEGGLAGAVDYLKDRFSGLGETMANNKPLFVALLIVLGGIAVALVSMLSPIVLVTAAIAGLVAGVVWALENVGWFRDSLDAVASVIKTLPDVFRFVKDNLATILLAMFSPLLFGAKMAFEGVRALYNGSIGGFGFDVPGWIPGVGGKSFRFPEIPAFPAIPGLAEGGIVTAPTLALIGEGNEAEAVIPLSRMGEMTGGGMSVTINMPAGSDGDDVVRALQSYQRRRGSLPLATGTRRF
jgi:TP901 family phage tail tape measure protein